MSETGRPTPGPDSMAQPDHGQAGGTPMIDDSFVSLCRVLVEHCGDGLLAAAATDLTILFANPAACGLFGSGPDALRRLRIPDLCATPGAAVAIRRLLEGSAAEASEIRCARADGSSFVADVRMTRVSVDGAELVICSLRDVTDRWSAFENIRRREGELQLVLDSIDEVVYAVRFDSNPPMGRLTLIEGRVEHLLGVARSAIRTDPALIFELLHEDDVEQARNTVLEMVRTRHPVTRILRMRHAQACIAGSRITSVRRSATT